MPAGGQLPCSVWGSSRKRLLRQGPMCGESQGKSHLRRVVELRIERRLRVGTALVDSCAAACCSPLLPRGASFLPGLSELSPNLASCTLQGAGAAVPIAAAARGGRRERRPGSPSQAAAGVSRITPQGAACGVSARPASARCRPASTASVASTLWLTASAATTASSHMGHPASPLSSAPPCC